MQGSPRLYPILPVERGTSDDLSEIRFLFFANDLLSFATRQARANFGKQIFWLGSLESPFVSFTIEVPHDKSPAHYFLVCASTTQPELAFWPRKNSNLSFLTKWVLLFHPNTKISSYCRLATLDPTFHSTYVVYAVRKFFFFLDPTRRGSIRIQVSLRDSRSLTHERTLLPQTFLLSSSIWKKWSLILPSRLQTGSPSHRSRVSMASISSSMPTSPDFLTSELIFRLFVKVRHIYKLFQTRFNIAGANFACSTGEPWRQPSSSECFRSAPHTGARLITRSPDKPPPPHLSSSLFSLPGL